MSPEMFIMWESSRRIQTWEGGVLSGYGFAAVLIRYYFIVLNSCFCGHDVDLPTFLKNFWSHISKAYTKIALMVAP